MPREDLWPGEWAEKHRDLDRFQTNANWAGPYDVWRQPATIGFMRLTTRPGVRHITVKKHAQGGWSEAARNWIGSRACCAPDPFLLVLPSEKKGRSIVQDRYLPLFDKTPCLIKLQSGRRTDKKFSKLVQTNGFVMRVGYSGSIDSVASDPARYVLNDERSKFDDNGKVSIEESIESRTATFEDSLVVDLSTPGPDPDPTSLLFDRANVKLYYFVKCPHCGTPQRLTRQRLEWELDKKAVPDKIERAAKVKAGRLAFFACENATCATEYPEGRGRIYDHHQPRLIREGFWAMSDISFRLFNDGTETGIPPVGDHWGMHAPAFISLAPKHTWSTIASKLIEAEGDPKKTRGVYNELLAEVYYDEATIVQIGVFERKCLPDPERNFIPGKAKIVPKWASRLIMTVDTQGDHFWYVIRAWGNDLRSRRIAHGKVQTFDELDYLWMEAQFPYEENAFAPLKVFMVGIDSGGGIVRNDEHTINATRTDQVYRWTMRYPHWLKAIKGYGRKSMDGAPYRPRTSTYGGRGGAYKVFRHDIDSNYYEDLLQDLVMQKRSFIDTASGEEHPDAYDAWEENDVNDPVYNAHNSNTKRVVIRGKGTRWVPSSTGARHDLRDCNVYQVFMATEVAQVRLAPSPAEMARQVAAMREAEKRPAAGLTTPDGRAFLITDRE